MAEARAAAVLSALMSARMPDRPAECMALLLALAGNRIRFLGGR